MGSLNYTDYLIFKSQCRNVFVLFRKNTYLFLPSEIHPANNNIYFKIEQGNKKLFIKDEDQKRKRSSARHWSVKNLWPSQSKLQVQTRKISFLSHLRIQVYWTPMRLVLSWASVFIVRTETDWKNTAPGCMQYLTFRLSGIWEEIKKSDLGKK